MLMRLDKLNKNYVQLLIIKKKFRDVKECQQYIEQTTEKDRLILIVSGRLGREIVPLMHQLRQIISIYIYCMDKQANEQWSTKFPKVTQTKFNLIFFIF